MAAQAAWAAVAAALGTLAWSVGIRWAAALAENQPAAAPTRGDRAWRWTVVVALAAASFGVLAARSGDPWHPAAAVTLAAVLLLIAVVDGRTRLIPLAAVAALAVVGSAIAAAEQALPDALLGGAAGGGLFLGLWLTARPLAKRGGEEPLGSGDVLLAAAIGLSVGWPDVLRALFLGALAGAVWSAALLATGKQQPGDAIPYGVFLCLGAAVALLG